MRTQGEPDSRAQTEITKNWKQDQESGVSAQIIWQVIQRYLWLKDIHQAVWEANSQ